MPKPHYSNLLKKLDKRQSLAIVLVVSILLLGLFGWLWWQKVYSNPRRVFWSMVSSSLKTLGVSRRITQSAPGGSLDQQLQLAFGAQDLTHSLVTLIQPGVSGDSMVRSENIGTPSSDYVRYLSIDTKQTNPQGKPLDFSKVIGVWGRSDSSLKAPNTAQLLDEAIFGFVPFATLKPADRGAIVKLMQDSNVYNVSYDTASRKHENGRSVMVFDVQVAPQPYIVMLHQLAIDMGLGNLQNLDPAAYQGVPTIKLQMTVDILSRQLMKIHYVDANREEVYSGYGINLPLSLPVNTVPISVLQTRLQSSQ